ncbi:MAG TPA: hypothetical protein VGQ57_15950 [Polyangiaceae bacterium]|jgi:hypothetical protein|nr:hypothetical protein [Polyangiaceae bacterium]
MQANKIHIKIFAQNPPEPDHLVPVFHSWIREKKLDELAIDVANYEHVHEGPGVVLVGNAFDYYWDLGDGRPGLIYSRKRNTPPPEARLADAVRRTLVGCRLLEQDPALPGLSFRTNELVVRLADRLHAPSNAAGFEALKLELEPLVSKLYGVPATIERVGDDRDILGARVTVLAAGSVADLLARLS